jgi:hypothetical protein
MRWLRLYDDTINDPKILKLPEAMRWHWIAMLCVASKNEGALPNLDDIAIQLRVTPAKATEILSALVKATLLDKTETGFAPHNWNGRQYKSDVSTERVKRFRNGKRNVSVTPPETEAETDTEVGKKETREIALADDWPSDYREQFWGLFPNKVGKPKALAKLDGCRKRGIVFAEIIAGLDRYIHTKPPDRAWLNPETFLNQERWADQPAETLAQGHSNGQTRSRIIQAADDLSRKIASFDGPAGQDFDVRDAAGAASPRLLSHG